VTKLHIPQVSPKLVARPRLLARLADGLTRPLTLISAPTGFGKTTLLGEWHATSSSDGYSLAWLSLDDDDNDLARFLAYVIAALATLKHGVGDAALILLQAPHPPPLKTIVTALINDLETIPAPFVLVLDDYHVITTSPIHEALGYLLDHLPPHMRLVILTRTDPPFTFARWRARNQLTELRASDLRFTRAEASGFLERVMGLNLSPEAIATLETRTEGWIAGLQIAALSMRDQTDVASFIKTFTGSNRFILDYLAEEVFQQQPQAVQDFLVRTSILDRLTGPLCDTVTEQADGAQTLQGLERINLFIVSLDNERRWYRYHHLFAEVLRNRLHSSSPILVPELHRRAARWFESQADVFEALKHWLTARDFAQTVRLLETVGVGMLERGAVLQLLGWARQIPAEHIPAHSWLNIYLAWAMLLTGQIGDLDARLDVIERELHAYPDEIGSDRLSKLGHIVAIRAYVSSLRGDLPRTFQLAHQAHELLPPEAISIHCTVAFILGNANVRAGNVAEAEKCFAEAARLGEQSGNIHIALPALCILAEQGARHGRLHHAFRAYQDALRLGTGESGHLLPIASQALVRIGNLYFEWNDLVAAGQHLEKSVELSALWGNADVQMFCNLSLARLRQVQGNQNAALTRLAEAVQIAQRSTLTAPASAILAAFQMRIALANGDLPSAAQLAEQRGLRHDGELNAVTEVEYIAYARVLVAQRDFAAADALLERLYQKAEADHRRSSVIEILILRSLVFQALTDISQALTMLGTALALAEPEGYVRVFIDEGEPMIELLRRAGSRGIAPRYVTNLLSATTPKAEISDRAVQPLIEPLSEREIEVLGLLAAGLSNQAIAEKLFVAVGTVKAHTSSIYRKLDVTNRTQAVARARDLNLI
jgi:LuxR family transcriptional regulator, maltose regulon positive regulatory protein